MVKSNSGQIGEAGGMDYVEQAVHDLQSPIMALSLIVGGMPDVHPEKKRIIDSALARVLGIAKQLRHPKLKEDPTRQWRQLEDLMVPLLDEKRIEHSPRRIEIHLMNFTKLFWDHHLVLAQSIFSSDFQRVLSNLINNAAEASPASGVVVVRLLKLQTRMAITIEDEGEGFDPQILAQLGRVGLTTKEHGMGRGLYHAIQTVEREWHGELVIESVKGKGSLIKILLPLAAM